jgi:hypothetical protein
VTIPVAPAPFALKYLETLMDSASPLLVILKKKQITFFIHSLNNKCIEPGTSTVSEITLEILF